MRSHFCPAGQCVKNYIGRKVGQFLGFEFVEAAAVCASVTDETLRGDRGKGFPYSP